MPSLKEIKGRIGSVKSTLKITSAMKLVASSKLRRAQQAVQSMLPYEQQLHTILQDLMTDYAAKLDLGKMLVVLDFGVVLNRAVGSITVHNLVILPQQLMGNRGIVYVG